jgi:hypothetical protein
MCAIAALALLTPGGRVHAQNDWQYPDPYFGILEIEKSRRPAAVRRYDAEARPGPKPQAQARPPRLFRPRPVKRSAGR